MPNPALRQAAGFGIMFDDVVAAACTLGVMAIWRYFQ
jgi:phosphatidylglycerophosphatase A